MTPFSLCPDDARSFQETIRRNRPVVIYESLPGWTVTQDMIDSMKIPQEVSMLRGLIPGSVDNSFKPLQNKLLCYYCYGIV